MRNSLRITLLLLGAGLLMLAAGCGSSKSAGSASGNGPTTTQDTSTTPVGSIPSTTTGVTGSFATARNCRQFAGLAAKIAGAMSPTSGDTKSSLQTEARELQAFADAAPSDIKGDFQTFATAFSSYLQALAHSGYTLGATTPPTAAQVAALTNAAKVFSSAKLTKAEQHLSTWVQGNCN